MLRMDQVHVIRHKVLIEGRKVRAVARELGVSRNSVSNHLGVSEPEVLEQSSRSKPMQEKIAGRVEAVFEEWHGRTTGLIFMATNTQPQGAVGKSRDAFDPHAPLRVIGYLLRKDFVGLSHHLHRLIRWELMGIHSCTLANLVISNTGLIPRVRPNGEGIYFDMVSASSHKCPSLSMTCLTAIAPFPTKNSISYSPAPPDLNTCAPSGCQSRRPGAPLEMYPIQITCWT